jgi:hypothetical protein
MHILDFLSTAKQESVQGNENSIEVEYRLICSGTLFPANFLGDWSKSDIARILLRHPIELLVASAPYDQYPQELAARFIVPLVREREGKVLRSYHPDEEIASDLAALLTLLCRRLLTVSAKIRARHHNAADIEPLLADYPVPAMTTAKISYWAPRPLNFLYSLSGVQVQSYHPHPQAFDRNEIGKILLALPQLKVAPAVIRAAGCMP